MNNFQCIHLDNCLLLFANMKGHKGHLSKLAISPFVPQPASSLIEYELRCRERMNLDSSKESYKAEWQMHKVVL